MESFRQYVNPFNPFNSWKFMFHSDRIKRIIDWLNGEYGVLPPPVYVTVDPTDVCSHACPWCISSEIQQNDNTTLKKELLISLAKVLSYFSIHMDGKRTGVNAIVLAGGGEPLVNPATIDFLKELSDNKNGFFGGPEFSMITNGELLTPEISEILAEHASWVGFSVDSGTEESHRLMHSPKRKNSNVFNEIISNIKYLGDARAKYKRKVPLNIGYKFLIHPDSVSSMVQGARIAKDIGCDEIQFRPVSVPNAFEIMPPIIEEAQKNILLAREQFEDASFKVHGVIHKVGPAWQPNHDFGACTMTPLGLIFSADGNMYLCCDRRGDPKLNLGPWHNGQTAHLGMIMDAWGSNKHRELIKNINTDECPRCTFYFYNKCVQEALVKDNMNRSFL